MNINLKTYVSESLVYEIILIHSKVKNFLCKIWVVTKAHQNKSPNHKIQVAQHGRRHSESKTEAQNEEAQNCHVLQRYAQRTRGCAESIIGVADWVCGANTSLRRAYPRKTQFLHKCLMA